jgi:hypothetical protein
MMRGMGCADDTRKSSSNELYEVSGTVLPPRTVHSIVKVGKRCTTTVWRISCFGRGGALWQRENFCQVVIDSVSESPEDDRAVCALI